MTEPTVATTDPADAAFAGWKRQVTIFLTGQTVSLLGSMLVQFAVMWHLTIETRSGAVLMWSIVFGMLPQAFVSIFGGVWADRHNRKLLIILADTTIAVTTLALALLMLSGVDDLWVIYVALAVRSTFAGIQTPAVGALVPQIVPADQLLRINGINQTIQSGMMLLAPALAAALYANLTIVSVFFVDVATALIGIGLLLLVRVPPLPRRAEDVAESAGTSGYFGDLRAGLRYIGAHSSVRWLTGLLAIVIVLVGAPSYLTPLMVTRTFGPEVWKLTVNELCWAAGMLAGGALMAVLGQRLRNRFAVVLGCIVAAGIGTVGLGLSTNLWVFYALGAVVAFSFSPMNAITLTIFQETVEPEMLGRVFGFVGIVMTVSMPLSMVVFGPLADQVSVESLLVAAGVLLLGALGLLMALPSARRSLREVAAPPVMASAPVDAPVDAPDAR